MAILLVLLPADTKTCLRSETMAALADLGVTNVALLQDEQSIGVVVEGWAFDASGSAQTVTAAVSDRTPGARTLEPVMEMTLSRGGPR